LVREQLYRQQWSQTSVGIGTLPQRTGTTTDARNVKA